MSHYTIFNNNVLTMFYYSEAIFVIKALPSVMLKTFALAMYGVLLGAA